MAIEITWDVYKSRRLYAVNAGDKRSDRVERHCIITGLDETNDALDNAAIALMDGLGDTWANPFQVPKKYVQTTRIDQATAFGYVVHDRSGQFNTAEQQWSANVRYSWKKSFRKATEFLNGWPAGPMLADTGTNSTKNPNKREDLYPDHRLLPFSVTDIVVSVTLVSDPTPQIAALSGYLNDSTFSPVSTLTFGPGQVRFDGGHVDMVLENNLPRWRTNYLFACAIGTWFEEEPKWVAEDQEWTTILVPQGQAANLNGLPGI